MDCVWLTAPPLDLAAASSYDTVNNLWISAQGFEAATEDNPSMGMLDSLSRRFQIPPNKALILIGGRESLADGLSGLASVGHSVQLQFGNGIGLFGSSAGGALNTATKKVSGLGKIAFASVKVLGRGESPATARVGQLMPETQRFTVIQLFGSPATINRNDLVVHFNQNSVTLRQIYTVLINKELLKES